MPQMDLIKKNGFDVLMLTDDVDKYQAAIDMANEGKTIGSDMLKPDYLRPSQAEREHSGKRA